MARDAFRFVFGVGMLVLIAVFLVCASPGILAVTLYNRFNKV